MNQKENFVLPAFNLKMSLKLGAGLGAGMMFAFVVWVIIIYSIINVLPEILFNLFNYHGGIAIYALTFIICIILSIMFGYFALIGYRIFCETGNLNSFINFKYALKLAKDINNSVLIPLVVISIIFGLDKYIRLVETKLLYNIIALFIISAVYTYAIFVIAFIESRLIKKQ